MFNPFSSLKATAITIFLIMLLSAITGAVWKYNSILVENTRLAVSNKSLEDKLSGAEAINHRLTSTISSLETANAAVLAANNAVVHSDRLAMENLAEVKRVKHDMDKLRKSRHSELVLKVLNNAMNTSISKTAGQGEVE